MSDNDEKDNVVELGVQPHDRVLTLADEVCKTLTRFYNINEPEEHLAALYLAEAAVQHIVVSKYGPQGLSEVVRRANDIRRKYGFTLVPEHTIYDEKEQPKVAPVVPLFRETEEGPELRKLESELNLMEKLDD